MPILTPDNVSTYTHQTIPPKHWQQRYNDENDPFIVSVS